MKAPASAIATTLLFILCNGQVTGASVCDTSLLTDSDNPLRYRERGERCEGLYVEQVAGTALLPVSLTARFDDFDPKRDQTLFLSWPKINSGSVQIRASGLAWDLPYRLDAVRAATDNPFRWPTNVIDAIGLGEHDIGVLAWVADDGGERQQRILLPLALTRQPAETTRSGEYRLVVIPGVPLEEVFLSIASTRADGVPTKFLIDGKPLAYSYYPAHRPLEIQLSGFAGPGRYYVELGARLRDGRSSTLSFLMQHGAD